MFGGESCLVGRGEIPVDYVGKFVASFKRLLVLVGRVSFFFQGGEGTEVRFWFG